MKVENAAPRPGHPIRERHQTLTIALHWVTALLVVTQIVLAILHTEASDIGIRRGALAAHRCLGIAIWLLMIGRLAWRLLGMRLLPFPATMPRWHQWGARLSEWGLYGLLLVQPLTGMAETVLRGRPLIFLGLRVPSLVAPHKAWLATAQGLHTLGAYALASLVLIHAGAAILHRLIANDGVLDSMLPVHARAKERSAPIQAAAE